MMFGLVMLATRARCARLSVPSVRVQSARTAAPATLSAKPQRLQPQSRLLLPASAARMAQTPVLRPSLQDQETRTAAPAVISQAASLMTQTLSRDAATVIDSLAQERERTPSDLYEDGQALEDFITGRKRAPDSKEGPKSRKPPEQPVRQDTLEERTFAVIAGPELAFIADNLSGQRNMKASRINGKDFLVLIEEARSLFILQHKSNAPSPKALLCAIKVQDQLLRVAHAMIKPQEPLEGQIRMFLSVWQTFNQALAEKLDQGTLKAIEDEAVLFAQQVEASV
jgi:hypothetical protein